MNACAGVRLCVDVCGCAFVNVESIHVHVNK